MALHPTTFDYLKPTDEQMEIMGGCREAAREYADFLEANLDDGPDKTFILRQVREIAMWVNVCVTRNADGSARA
jgi:hypothetical protein